MNRLLLFAIVALVIPVTAFAQVPSAVTGLSAVLQEDGSVRVRWDEPTDTDIDHYRIYYSGKSILDNNGVYDDFVATDDAKNEHVLTDLPEIRPLFVAVLAVNTAGKESDVFIEETSVQLRKDTITPTVTPQDPAPRPPKGPVQQDTTFTVTRPTEQRLTPEQIAAQQQSSAQNAEQIPEWQQGDAGGTLHLLLVEVLSAEQLKLTFSGIPTIEPEQAPTAFRIIERMGKELRITSIVLSEKTILVNTEVQEKGTVYEIQLSEPLQADNGAVLDTIDRRAFFQGHTGGKQPGVSPPSGSVVQPSFPQPGMPGPFPIRGLRLRATAQGNGTFLVNAFWELDNPYGDLVSYVVRQSIDGGRTFSEPQMVPLTIGGLEIPGVVSADYGLGITTMNAMGSISQEVFETIVIPGGQPAPAFTQTQQPAPTQQPVQQQQLPVQRPVQNTPPAQTTPRKPSTQSTSVPLSDRLAQTGGGLIAGSAAALGALAGWRIQRRRRARVS